MYKYRLLKLLLFVLLIGFQKVIAEAPYETLWLPEKAIQDTNSIWRNSIGYLQIGYNTWNAPVVILTKPSIFSDTLFSQNTFRNAISDSNIHLISMYGYSSDMTNQELKIADDFRLSNLFAKISILDSLKIDNLLWLRISYDLIKEKSGWIFVDSSWSTNYNSVVFFESNKILDKYAIPISLLSVDSTMMKFYTSADEKFSISKPVKLYFEPSNNHSGKNIGTSPSIKILDIKGDFIKVFLLNYKSPNETYWMRWKDKKGKLKILTIHVDEC
jgi:hypothetical protein